MTTAADASRARLTRWGVAGSFGLGVSIQRMLALRRLKGSRRLRTQVCAVDPSRGRAEGQSALVVDGSYLLQRAQDTVTSWGKKPLVPRQALHPFIQEFARLHRDSDHDCFVVVFDGPVECNWRRQALSSYRAAKDAADASAEEELRSIAIEICSLLEVHCLAPSGFEALDVVSSYVHAPEGWGRLRTESHPAMRGGGAMLRIHSGLRAMDSLVGHGAVLCTADKSDLSTAEDVEERWGVPASLVKDVIALDGRARAGVPGVPGVGPKTAAKLLKNWGGLEEVLEAAAAGQPLAPGGKAGGKVSQALRDHADAARLGRSLLEHRRVSDLPAMGALTKSTLHALAAASWCKEQGHSAVAGFLQKEAAFHPRPDTPSAPARASPSQDGASGRGAPSFEPYVFAKGPFKQGLQPWSPEGIIVVRRVSEVPSALQALRSCQGSVLGVACKVGASGPDSRLLCFAVYSCDEAGSRPCLWFDVSGAEDGREKMAAAVGELFTDEAYRWAFFDAAAAAQALANEGISLPQLAGDTMHLARLWDAASSPGAYSLENIAGICLGEGADVLPENKVYRKLAKDPQKLHLYQDPDIQSLWVNSCCRDAWRVHQLFADLRARLQALPWALPSTDDAQASWCPPSATMWDFYTSYWLPFGTVLSDMHLRGIRVDLGKLRAMERDADAAKEELQRTFIDWVVARARQEHGAEFVETANLEAMNVSSDKQLQVLLFGGVRNRERDSDETVPNEKEFPALVRSAPVGKGAGEERYRTMTVKQLQEVLRERGLAVSGKKAELVARLVDNVAPEVSVPPQESKVRAMVTLRGLGLGLQPTTYTLSGWPSVSSEAFRQLCDSQGDGLGQDGVQAVGCLQRITEVDGQLSSFLRPLIAHGRSGRVHSSFNLNTETGRLSSQNPNLQNQPAGGQIREAFVAEPGHCLIVADYAQLELRVVAHLASCMPMANALNAGGDFHSRTTAMMFPEVDAAVKAGEVSLDEALGNDASDGATLPTVKDRFSEERKQAKILNFGVLYGKTSSGLAKDWGLPVKEAQRIIDRWYDAFPEIQRWQALMEREAIDTEFVRTLLGRSRRLPGVRNMVQRTYRAALRAAINTPVQGGAADIVTLAMISLHESEKLRGLGFRLVHQIHDEVILEGPEAAAQEALAETVRILEDPLPFALLAPLKVQALIGKTWHEGKG